MAITRKSPDDVLGLPKTDGAARTIEEMDAGAERLVAENWTKAFAPRLDLPAATFVPTLTRESSGHRKLNVPELSAEIQEGLNSGDPAPRDRDEIEKSARRQRD